MDKNNSQDGVNDSSTQDQSGSSSIVHDASEQARQEALDKMKQAREASVSVVSNEGEDESGIKVKEGDIDPKAEKALHDLLGIDTKKIATILKSVKVYTPFRVYYDNEAKSVSAVNGTGPFDVLPGHKNFLSLLLPGDIVVRSATGKEERITIERGVMHVHDDTVKVFLDV